MYHILLKIFTDIDAYVYIKQRESTQHVGTFSFAVNEQSLGSGYMARQVMEAVRKLQSYHYVSEKKGWIGTSKLPFINNSTL